MSERDSRSDQGRSGQDRDQNRRSYADRDRQAQQWRDEGQSGGYQTSGYGQQDTEHTRDRAYGQMGGADDRYSDDRDRFDRDEDERATSREFSDDYRSFGPAYGGASYRSGPYGGGGGGGTRLGSYGGYADRSRNFGSFTSEDQGGRDFTSRDSGFGSYGRRSGGREEYRESDYRGGQGSSRGDARGPSAHPEAYATNGRDYMGDPDYSNWRQAGERRGFFERAGDTVASWFGGGDDARGRNQDRREDDHRGRGPSGYTRSDDRIREDANDALTHDRNVDATHITVKVESGEVTLDGTVRDRQSKRRAEDAVEHISGVKHVQNNLRVQDQSQSTSGHNQPGYNPSSAAGQSAASTGTGAPGAPSAASATGSSTGAATGGSATGMTGGTSTAASTAQKT